MRICLILAVVLCSTWLPDSAWPHCIPGHTGVKINLTQAQINTFCDDYSNLKQVDQLKYKATYNKYCEKPASTPPAIKFPVITKVSTKGNCLNPGDDLIISGRDFGIQGEVILSRPGDTHRLKIRSWSTTKVRAKVKKRLAPGRSYKLQIKTSNGTSSSKKISSCDEKTTKSNLPQPTNNLRQKGKADLRVKLTSPNQAIQRGTLYQLRVHSSNRGLATAGNFTIRLTLSRVKQSSKSVGLQSKINVHVLDTIQAAQPLKPKGIKNYFTQSEIPGDIDPGQYYLCAHIDPNNQVNESKENNNSDCKRVEIIAAAKQEKHVAAQLDPQLGAQLNQPLGEDLGELKSWFKQQRPTQIQPLIVYPSALTINGGMGTVEVATSGPAEVVWNFPIDSDNTEIFLRLSPMPFTTTCPGEDTPMDIGRAAMDTADSVLAGHPDRIYHSTGSGTTNLNIPSTWYTSGETYWFQGCGIRTDTSGNRVFTGDETNTVELQYGPAEEENPDLEILRIGYESPVKPLVLQNPRQAFIIVRNNGLSSARVFAAYVHPDRRSRRGPIMPEETCVGGSWRGCQFYSVGGVVDIPAGETRSLHLPLIVYVEEAQRALASPGGSFSTMVYLFDGRHRVDHGQALAGLYRDANMANHQRRISIPIDSNYGYRVSFRVTRLVIHRRCDNISPGDWVIFGDAQAVPNYAYGDRADGPISMPLYDPSDPTRYFHNDPEYGELLNGGGAVDVSEGQVVTDLALSSDVAEIAPGQIDSTSVIVNVQAYDCDLPKIGFTIDGRNPREEQRHYFATTSRFYHCTNGEETFEFTDSGDYTAYAGLSSAIFGPSFWKANQEYELDLSRVGDRSPRNNCGDGAFRATIKFQATPFWP